MPGRYDVSDGRKLLFYGGTVLIGIGIVLFFSTFFAFIGAMGAVSVNFGPPIMLRPFIGILLIGVGNGMRNVGAKGLAGSGLVLSPRKAREDLEPWSRMAGGMVDDALSEVETLKRPKEPTQEKTVVKVRCRNCGAFNPESAKFCNQCGEQL